MIDPEYQDCYDSGVRDARVVQAEGQSLDLSINMDNIEIESQKENPDWAWIAYDRGFLSCWD